MTTTNPTGLVATYAFYADGGGRYTVELFAEGVVTSPELVLEGSSSSVRYHLPVEALTVTGATVRRYPIAGLDRGTRARVNFGAHHADEGKVVTGYLKDLS